MPENKEEKLKVEVVKGVFVEMNVVRALPSKNTPQSLQVQPMTGPCELLFLTPPKKEPDQ